MSSVSLIRLGVLGAMLAGVAWMVSGIVAAVIVSGWGPEVRSFSFLDEALYVVALIGTLGGLVGLHARQAPSYGWLGTTGFLAAFVGSTLLLVGLLLSFLSDLVLSFLVGNVFESTFLDPILWLGLWGALVGFVLLGAATLRLGALPRWCGWLLIVAFLLRSSWETTAGGRYSVWFG